MATRGGAVQSLALVSSSLGDFINAVITAYLNCGLCLGLVMCSVTKSSLVNGAEIH